MAGVGGVMKLVKQLLNSWKVGKCSELKLICEDWAMKVTMSANLVRHVIGVTRALGGEPASVTCGGRRGELLTEQPALLPQLLQQLNKLLLLPSLAVSARSVASPAWATRVPQGRSVAPHYQALRRCESPPLPLPSRPLLSGRTGQRTATTVGQ